MNRENTVYIIVLPNTKLSFIDLRYLLFVLVGKKGRFVNCRWRSQAIKKTTEEYIQVLSSACERQTVSVDGHSVHRCY